LIFAYYTQKSSKVSKSINFFNAMIEAGKERIRPIVMTNFAMIYGMKMYFKTMFQNKKSYFCTFI